MTSRKRWSMPRPEKPAPMMMASKSQPLFASVILSPSFRRASERLTVT